MLRFRCKDVGVDCGFIATGPTVDEVKEKAFAHARIVHDDIMKGMNDQQMADLTKAVVNSIQHM